MINEYMQLFKSFLTSDVRDINSRLYGIKESYGPEDRETRRKKSIIGIVIGIALFASLLISLVLRQLIIFGYRFSQGLWRGQLT